jgi:hypothetical protein
MLEAAELAARVGMFRVSPQGETHNTGYASQNLGLNFGSPTIASTWVVLTAPASDYLSGAHKSGQSPL